MSSMPPKKRGRYKRTISASDLIRDLAKRPAMNGGFQKLAEQQDLLVEQQDAQCRELKEQSGELKEQSATLVTLKEHGDAVDRKLEKVETWQTHFDRRFAWGVGILGTLTLSVVGRLAYDVILAIASHWR